MSKFGKNFGTHVCSGNANTVYALGMVGALVYYFQQATTLMDGLLGVVKAILWPALVIYKVLETMQM